MKTPDWKKYKGIELPDFLYVDEGEIKIGFHGDTICTEEFEEWIEYLKKELCLK